MIYSGACYKRFTITLLISYIALIWAQGAFSLAAAGESRGNDCLASDKYLERMEKMSADLSVIKMDIAVMQKTMSGAARAANCQVPVEDLRTGAPMALSVLPLAGSLSPESRINDLRHEMENRISD